MEESGSDVSLNKAKGDEAEEGLVEKLIRNGNLYVGFCTRNWPKGMEKHICSDGCLYQGLWAQVKLSDKGNIPWPLDATYVGYIDGSCIHGYGCYTECNGEIYEGQWVMNHKRGYGNGDFYEGWWRSGVFDGHERYNRHWRREVMSSKGILLWASSYEYWRQLVNEVPQQSCEVLNYKNEGILCGRWKKCTIVRNCRYYPLCVNFEWLKLHARTGVFTTDNGGKSELVGYEHRVLCSKYLDTFLDDAPSKFKTATWFSGNYGDLQVDVPIADHPNDVLESELSVFQCAPLDLQKKLGEVICKGHGKYELMRVLQLGIRFI